LRITDTSQQLDRDGASSATVTSPENSHGRADPRQWQLASWAVVTLRFLAH